MFCPPATAQEEEGEVLLLAKTGRNTGLPVPRFVSLKKSEANMRIGPGEDYSVKWVYQRRNLPMEVIGEHELWRQVRDRDGDEGWIHSSLLAGRRYGVITSRNVRLLKKPGARSVTVIAYIHPDVVVRLLACSPAWCRIQAQGYKGWVERRHLWGLHNGEIFD